MPDSNTADAIQHGMGAIFKPGRNSCNFCYRMEQIFERKRGSVLRKVWKFFGQGMYVTAKRDDLSSSVTRPAPCESIRAD
jgi:hypothetical protein